MTARLLGPAVDPSGFVAADVVREDRGSLAALESLVAEDGARQASRIIDKARETACDEVPADENPRFAGLCVPDWSGIADVFGDAECSSRLARTNGGLEEGSTAYAWIPRADCSDLRAFEDVVTIGDVHAGSVYEATNGQCAVATEVQAAEVREVGDVVPPETLWRFGREHAGSEGAVAEWSLSPDGQRLMVDDFCDTASGARCTPARGSDCRIHCFPVIQMRMVVGLDQTCARWGVLQLDGSDCDPVPPAMVQASDAWAGCSDYVTRVFRVGPHTTRPDVAYQGDSCSGFWLPDMASAVYEATEVPASAFPELQEATE